MTTPQLTDEQRLFESAHCGNNRDTVRKNSTTGEYVLPSINDAWAGFQTARALLAQPAAAGQGEAATQDKLDSLLEAAQYLSHRRRVAAAPPATQGQDAAPAERDALQARVDAEPEGFTQGIDAAAKMLDKMADDYSRAHAIQDPDTGVYEFGRGAKEDYYNTLRELADDVRSIVYAPGERENAAQTLKAAKDAAFEQAANLVELEYAPDAKAGKRLAQIAQHIRDLKKWSL